jgi:transcriptional antiterminator NusG
MKVTDNSWYVLRNTPKVTGFIGPGTTPLPVSPDEMNFITKKTTKEEPKYTLNVDVDDLVKIIDGPFKDFEGKVSEVDESKGKLKVLVNMFGRNTPVELDSLQIKKV